jgi:hypothetical protein
MQDTATDRTRRIELGRAGDPQRWGLILAGGEGGRLRPLTRAIAGDECPKQFCAVVGFETLIERTQRQLRIHPAWLGRFETTA